MLSKNGQVKLIDFGTAWVRGQDKDRIQGTPQFMAPEQAIEKVVNEKTDIYNFGATMYRMFTGRFVQQAIPKPGDERKVTLPNKINPRILADLNTADRRLPPEHDPDKRPVRHVRDPRPARKIAKQMGLEEVDLKGADEE